MFITACVIIGYGILSCAWGYAWGSGTFDKFFEVKEN